MSMRTKIAAVGVIWMVLVAVAHGDVEPPYDPAILPAESYSPSLPINVPEKAGNIGAARLSYPILVPPGRRGTAPQLSLEYNSGSGNGPMGVGWRLSLSVIQRSTRNGLFYKGTSFEHDGEELVSRTDWGNGYYGAKRESLFSKYQMASPETGWIVTTRDGVKYYFGASSASQINNPYGVFQWCLDRVEDPNGNYYSITYLKDQGQIYASQISYTGNKSLSPTHVVTFSYENRPDLILSYLSQFQVVTAKRLKSITTMANGVVARTYIFSYENAASGRSRLKKIEASPLPPAEFTYQDGGNGSFISGKTFKENLAYNNSGFVFEGHCNFGGYPDLIKFNWSTTPYVYVYPSDGQGGFQTQPIRTMLAGSVNEAGFLLVADLDADGVVDIVKIQGTGNVYLHRGIGNGGFSSAVPSNTGGVNEKGRILVGDVVGQDGRLELVRSYKNYVTVHKLLNGVFQLVGTTNLGVNVDPGRLLVMDCNGDRQDDLVLVSSGAWAGVTVFLSRGDGTFAAGIPTELGNGVNDPGRLLSADFNGDGLIDLLKLKPLSSTVYVYFSLGNGSFSEAIETELGGEAIDAGRILIGDVDKDGLQDIVRHYWNSAAVDCYRSNGDGTFRAGIRTPNTSGALYKGFASAVNLDGSGGTDLIRRDQYGNVYTYLSSPKVPDLLVRATNGLGATFSFDYRSSAGYANHYLPFVVETISRSSVNDGNGVTATQEYDYEGGAYDPQEAEFRGFERIEQTLPDQTIAETLYHQDEYLCGKEHQVKHLDPQANLLTLTSLDWLDVELNGGARFVRLKTKREDRYYKPVVFTEEAYEYSPIHGHVVKDTRSGTNAEAVTTTRSYIKCGDWNWKPASEILEGPNADIVRKTFFAYDTRGNKTREERWGDGEASPITLWSYDAYGNPLNMTDPKGNLTVYTYESKTYTYANKITLPKTGQTAHVWTAPAFDYRVGKATEIKDENGNVTSYQYDAVGRLLQADFPDGGRKVFTYTDSPYPSKVKTVVLVSQGPPESTITSFDYFDGLGRKIKTVAYDELKRPIYSRTLYDVMGRLWKKEGPFYSTTQPGGYPWEETSFDYWSRPLALTRPEGPGGALATTSFAYSGLSETKTDPDGAKKQITKDYLGQVIQVVEYLNQEAITTGYDYNSANELLGITNHAGIATEFGYDSLGRLRVMKDPDMGRWAYAYDANGNLITQTDNKGRIMTLEYDALNRLLAKRYSTSDPNSAAAVTYTYDNPADPNGKGRLFAVKNSPTTIITDAYDEMGRTLTESRTFNGNSTVYTTGYEFDLAGGLLSMTYPLDGFRVAYSYHPGTRLIRSVVGPGGEVYAELEDYTPDGKIGYLYQGNNTATTLSYDSRSTRLTGIRIQGPGMDTASDIFYKTYSYTPAGDISQIKDEIRSITRNYTYDALHRLISETVPNSASGYPAPRVIRMAYSYDGPGPFHAPKQIIIGDQTHVLQYDANGNLLIGPGLSNPGAVSTRNVAYTFENMPSRIDQPGATSPQIRFTYDGENRRATKVSSQGTTFYIGKHYEVLNGAPTRYIFAGALRLAKVTSAGVQHYHKDHLMNSVAVSDGAGNAVQSQDFIPFGQERGKSDQRVTCYLYTDQELDPETSLYNYKARLYDPFIGSFETPDPYFSPNLAAHLRYSKLLSKSLKPNDYARYLSDSQKLNRYAYVLNNPSNYLDPHGLEMALSDSGDIHLLLGLPDRNFYMRIATLLTSFFPLSPGGFGAGYRSGVTEFANTSKTNLPSTIRRTVNGETFVRYESGHPKYTRVTPEGSLLPGTYAAPTSEGILHSTKLPSQYNLPEPQIPRTLYYEIKPPTGTWIEGPKPVMGGSGNEVVFPYGAPPGSVGFPMLMP